MGEHSVKIIVVVGCNLFQVWQLGECLSVSHFCFVSVSCEQNNRTFFRRFLQIHPTRMDRNIRYEVV